MLIAHVRFSVAQRDANTALDTLMSHAGTVRKMPGCLAFTPFVNPTTPTEVCVQHEWDIPSAFYGYTGSDTFQSVTQVLRPLMTAPPISRRFDATLIETS